MISKIGQGLVDGIWKTGFMARFFFLLLIDVSSLIRFNLVIREIYFFGVLSILIIAVSGAFVGMVLALQGYSTLSAFGSTGILGSVVALTLLRELGPVLAALLFASRSGSAITAEIGLMKTTEQLSAMEVMGINPMVRVAAPRFWAGAISMPFLAAICNVCGILGGYFIAVKLIGLDEGNYWSQMKSSVNSSDVLNGMIKSFVFGILVTLIAVFEGMNSQPSAAGISAATTRTVVTSALVILASDFVLTAFMF